MLKQKHEQMPSIDKFVNNSTGNVRQGEKGRLEALGLSERDPGKSTGNGLGTPSKKNLQI